MFHIKKVADLAIQFRSDTAHKGKVPKDLDELKAWAVKAGKAEEADFNSTRDNEPYVLIPSGMEVIVHEKTGQDGRKWMMGRTPTPIEGTDADVERFTGMGQMGTRGKQR
jgi:hypothetical protein